MILEEFCVENFRNIRCLEIALDSRLNVFYGDNAQGKTNILEAIWLCSGCRSFRNAKEKELIPMFFDGKLKLLAKVRDSQRQQEISYSMGANTHKKELLRNGVKLGYPSQLFGTLNCVLFTPEDLFLTKGSPEKRRAFVDLSIAQIKNSYSRVLARYNALLAQRNATLRNGGSISGLSVWDVQMAKAGSFIALYRHVYSKKLCEITSKLYRMLSRDRERLDIWYKSSVFEESELEGCEGIPSRLEGMYLERLEGCYSDDIRAGFTTIGIHRDDLVSSIDGVLVRDFGSQGQQRSVALVMKLSQAKILEEELRESPVVLLDDVLSELDLFRQEFVLSLVEGMQIILTCCDPRVIKDLNRDNAAVFLVKDGDIIDNVYTFGQ